jgi:hypothetical protein
LPDDPPLPPRPPLPTGETLKPVDPEQVKKEVAGPGCQMVEMQVTGYFDGHPRTADNTRTANGVMAVADSKPKPYPFGTKAQVLNTNGTVRYSGVVHDTGNGWNSAYHNIRPEEFLDVFRPDESSAGAVGNGWFLVRLCPPR